jgi:hypothetical protein
MDTIKRTSRESELRKEQEAPKVWIQPSSLDAPPAPKGYAHRWIRVTVQGFEDTSNVPKKLREGWDFVKIEQVSNEIGSNKFPYYTEGKYSGLIGVGGLVLARIPVEIFRQRSAYFNRKITDQVRAVDSDLMKEQRPDMPINIDRQSRVTFGGSKK